MYYGCYEEFIRVVVLWSWVLYVIVDYIYAIETTCKYMRVHLGGLYGFYGDEYGVQICS